jgi:hypothetical protein
VAGILFSPKRPWCIRAFNAPVGEWMRHHGLRRRLDRGRDSLKGWDPLSEVEIRSRG